MGCLVREYSARSAAMHEVRKNQKVRFNDEIVNAEVYLYNGVPKCVYVDGIDDEIDARFVEILDHDACITRPA